MNTLFVIQITHRDGVFFVKRGDHFTRFDYDGVDIFHATLYESEKVAIADMNRYAEKLSRQKVAVDLRVMKLVPKGTLAGVSTQTQAA